MLSIIGSTASVGLARTLASPNLYNLARMQHPVMRSLSTFRSQMKKNTQPVSISAARYHLMRNYPHRKRGGRLRPLFFMFLASWGLLLFVTSRVDRKAPKTSFSQREYESYEKESGLKRRTKLITPELKERYKFFAVPFSSDDNKSTQALAKALNPTIPQKVIDPAALVHKEIAEEGKYSYLLEELKATGRQFPPGLVTALVKQEIQLFTNTTKGQFETNIVLLNYPQTTEEAIKFENDVSDFDACVVTPEDYNRISTEADESTKRKIDNVYGYFDILNKFKKLGQGVLE